MAQVRGVVKLPHTPSPRLGVTAHRQAEYACGGPADAEPTFGGAPAIPLDRASFKPHDRQSPLWQAEKRGQSPLSTYRPRIRLDPLRQTLWADGTAPSVHAAADGL